MSRLVIDWPDGGAERVRAARGRLELAGHALSSLPIEERIRRVVAALVRYMGSNPDYPRLLLQQIVASPLPHPVVQSAVRENLLMLQRLVEEGQADGSIREGDPLLMALSLISQPAHMSVVLRPVRHIMEIPEEAEAFLDRLSTHAADFAVRALEAREESP